VRTLLLLLAAAVLAAVVGCSNLERSRNLGDPAVSGRTLAQQVCSLCHGADGNSTSPQFPKLAGQQKDYLVAQLKNFRGHERLDPPGPEYMWGLSHRLTDEQIDGIAAYFSELPPMRLGRSNPARVAAGMEIYQHGLPDSGVPACQTCHQAAGQGLATFPRLAGQHQDYVVRQLHVFQETDYRPNTPMTGVTHQLTSQQMVEVAAFVAAFPPSR
jgi:cytochrome c553